jgi:membrane associated rhomboid family serine protease
MRSLPQNLRRQPELWGFICLLILCNIHLLSGNTPAGFAGWPDVCTGSYVIRILVHPFVHVSWYHFMLDAGAFFLLYTGLQQKAAGMRLFYLGACAAGSLAASLALSPLVRTNGLCGLSGVAHGLMAIAALEMIAAKQRVPGALCLGMVFIKSIVEIVGGEVLFMSLHFGHIGNAIPAAHLGGALGGVAVYAIAAYWTRVNAAHTRHTKHLWQSTPL